MSATKRVEEVDGSIHVSVQEPRSVTSSTLAADLVSPVYQGTTLEAWFGGLKFVVGPWSKALVPTLQLVFPGCGVYSYSGRFGSASMWAAVKVEASAIIVVPDGMGLYDIRQRCRDPCDCVFVDNNDELLEHTFFKEELQKLASRARRVKDTCKIFVAGLLPVYCMSADEKRKCVKANSEIDFYHNIVYNTHAIQIWKRCFTGNASTCTDALSRCTMRGESFVKSVFCSPVLACSVTPWFYSYVMEKCTQFNFK